MLWFNGVLMATAIAGTIAIGWQIHDARQESAKSDLDFEKTLAEMKRTADAGVKAAQAAEANAHTLAENARLEQRAWVGFLRAETHDIAAGSVPRFKATLSNTGRTPATSLHTAFMVRQLPPGLGFVPTYQQDKDAVNSESVLPPNGLLVVEHAATGPFSEDDIHALRVGATRVYLYGRFDYKDIFGCRHSGTFCTYITPGLQVKNCSVYNTVGPSVCPSPGPTPHPSPQEGQDP